MKRAEHTAETSGAHMVDMIHLCRRSRERRSVQCGTGAYLDGRLDSLEGTKMLERKVIGRVKANLWKILPTEGSHYLRLFRPIASFMANLRDRISSDVQMHYSCNAASLLISDALRVSRGNQESSPIEAFMTHSDHGLHQSVWGRVKQAVSSHPIIRGSFRERRKKQFQQSPIS